MLAAAASSIQKPQVVTKTLTEYVGPKVASVEQPEETAKRTKSADPPKMPQLPVTLNVASTEASDHSSSMLPGMPIAQQALGKLSADHIKHER